MRTSRGPVAVPLAVTVVFLLLIELLDYVTGPRLNFTILYFGPIIYAAWALGRVGAVIVALVSEVTTYTDQVFLVSIGEQSYIGAVSTIIVRLLVYLFVAEVTVRLIRSREDARRAAEEARALAEELQAAYDRLDEDARAGGLLQVSELAFSPPAVPGCEVGTRIEYAQRVGGDFADAGNLNGRIFACVGDISGKGTPAALFTLLLKHLLTSVHSRGLDAGRTVAALSEDLCRALPEDRFVTLFYAQIDPGSGRVDYINAGHPEGLIFRHEDASIELAGNNAPLLGCMSSLQEVTESTLRLQPGDLLVLYTDGATESKMHDGTRLGDDCIKHLVEEFHKLDAQEMVDAIVHRIEEITDERWRDDLAVMCIKRTQIPN